MIGLVVALKLLPLPLSLWREGRGEGVGLQRSEISLVPPEPLPLGGYTARGGKLFVPGGDDLKCRTVVLGGKVALVSCEMLTIPESLVREVRRQLPSGIFLFLSATHTHCAPDSQMLNDRMTFNIPGIASYKSRWLEWTSGRIATCVREALASPLLTVGHWSTSESVLRMNRGRRPGAVPSPLLQVLYADGKPVAVNYAAHPVNYDSDTLTLQSDWPGTLMRSLGCLAFPGSLGDVSPNFGAGSPREKIERFVNAVSLAATSQQNPPPQGGGSLSPAKTGGGVAGSKGPRPRLVPRHPLPEEGESALSASSATLPMPKPTPHPTFAKVYKINDVLANLLVSKFAPAQITATTIRLGRLCIIGISGEPTADLGREIALVGRNAGYEHVWVIAHVNGWGGYMLEPDDYDRGGYEAELSFYGRNERAQILECVKQALSQKS